jgi:hypothetical protein
MLQIIPRLQNAGMHFFHRIAQFHPKPTQDLPLPCIVLRVHPRLHLLVVHHTHATERPLRLARVEGRPRLLDLSEQLLPKGETVPKSGVDGLGFKIPERLELKPFPDVGFELLDLLFDESEGPLKSVIRKLGELEIRSTVRYTCANGVARYAVPAKYMLSPSSPSSGSVVQSRILSSGSSAIDIRPPATRGAVEPRSVGHTQQEGPGR